MLGVVEASASGVAVPRASAKGGSPSALVAGLATEAGVSVARVLGLTTSINNKYMQI